MVADRRQHVKIPLNHTRYAKGEADLIKFAYADGVPALRLSQDGEPLMVASTYVGPLQGGTIAIKNYSENEGVEQDLIEAGVISHKPVGFVKSGFVSIPIYQLLI